MKSPRIERRPHPDDIALWPDGTWAEMREVWEGEYNWKSDDYEVIPYDQFDHEKGVKL